MKTAGSPRTNWCCKGTTFNLVCWIQLCKKCHSKEEHHLLIALSVSIGKLIAQAARDSFIITQFSGPISAFLWWMDLSCSLRKGPGLKYTEYTDFFKKNAKKQSHKVLNIVLFVHFSDCYSYSFTFSAGIWGKSIQKPAERKKQLK